MPALPEWSRELVDLYESNATTQFILHGNVNDRLLLDDKAGVRLGGLPDFLEEVLLPSFDVVLSYDLGNGLRACFRSAEGDIRDLSVTRLPEFKAAWASTVHKSQGSEFDSVLLILPADTQSEVLSRELLYTAITRARRQFLLHAPGKVVTRAVDSLTRRHSGLALKLGWPHIEPGPA